MRNRSSIEDEDRFRGRLKSYHRQAPVEQEDGSFKRRWPWGTIILSVLGLAMLVVIVVALCIHLSW